MKRDKSDGPDEADYQKLKTIIDKTFPRGRFVAIDKGRVIADAASVGNIIQMLRATGANPRETLVVQAGIDEPEEVMIFLVPLQL